MFDPEPSLVSRRLDTAPRWLQIFAEAADARRLVEHRFEMPSAPHDPSEIKGHALVASDQVLQWLTRDGVERALGAAAQVAAHGVFRIATRYSTGPLQKGRNEFQTVADASWWCQRIAAAFGHAEAIDGMPPHYCVIVTWPVGPFLAERIAAIQAKAVRARTWARRRERLRGRFWRLIRPTLGERRVLRQLAGKRVALVGNASSLSEGDHGAAIDAADVVIRCNRGILVSQRSHGQRPDWLITALPISRQTAKRRGIERVVWASLRPMMLRNIPAWMFAQRCLHVFSRRRDARLREVLGKTASTGMKAIDLIADSGCARLDIYGFDFASTRSASQPTRPMSRDHDFDAERRHAREIFSRDERVHWHP